MVYVTLNFNVVDACIPIVLLQQFDEIWSTVSATSKNEFWGEWLLMYRSFKIANTKKTPKEAAIKATGNLE